MNWLDPVQCHAARHFLDAGNARAAAEVLLESKHFRHRAVQQLLLTCQKELVQQAQQLFLQQSSPAVVLKLLDLASQCVQLPPQAEAFRERVRRESARHMAAFASSRQSMAAAQGDAYNDQQGFADHESSMAVGDSSFNFDDAGGDQRPDQRTALSDRQQSFTINDDILVVPAPIATIGLGQKEPVQLPCSGPLHNLHAQITRTRSSYFVSPCPHPSRQPYVAVTSLENRRGLAHFAESAEQNVPVPLSANCCTQLHDGQQIELGDPQLSHLRFTWEFKLPQVLGSTTALLDTRSKPVTIRDHDQTRHFNQVVLLHDSLVIRPAAPAHWIVAGLPCQQLTLRWSTRGLTADVTGGILVEEPEYEPPTTPLRMPCELIVASLDQPGRHQIVSTNPSKSTMKFHLKLVRP